jgi:hypothetical protein
MSGRRTPHPILIAVAVRLLLITGAAASVAGGEAVARGHPYPTAAATLADGGPTALSEATMACGAGPNGDWVSFASEGTPAWRSGHTAVWTGDQMIVWGGSSAAVDNHRDGVSYDPRTDRWRPISTEGAPSPRDNHSAVWTGMEMIVWGGTAGRDPAYFGDGARYNPISDTWQPMTMTGAPTPRSWHNAVWTGQEMFVWGGSNPAAQAAGGRYDPATDTWSALPPFEPTRNGIGLALVWTGQELIASDGRWDPTTNAWSYNSNYGAPTGGGSAVVWTGSKALVWRTSLNRGRAPSLGAYDPVTNRWEPISQENAPGPRNNMSAVWTGREMIIWGGSTFSPPRNSVRLRDGGAYDPATDTWRSLPDGPQMLGHTAVWTGSEMIVFGGPGIGGRYRPPCP